MNRELLAFVHDPRNPQATYELASWYYQKGHTASALAFYLRTVETSKDDILTYECLCLVGLCLLKQGDRLYHAKGAFLHAINLLPMRPEAYHLMSRTCEWNKEWQDAYTWANLGLLQEVDIDPIVGLEYYGRQALLFEKAVSGWWINRTDECLLILVDLQKNYKLPLNISVLVEQNIASVSMIRVGTVNYTPLRHDAFKYKFSGISDIYNNYSQAMQDMFVLSVLNGKRNGTYLEVGSNDPFYLSNTALLEKDFGWMGVSIDINRDMVESFRRQRTNVCLHEDALKADWYTILQKNNMPGDIDYLQVDCDPPENSLSILFNIPFDDYRFGVITFEHDYYTRPESAVRARSRNFLRLLGYKLIVANASVGDHHAFEDWWVHPDLVDNSVVNSMIVSDKDFVDIDSYFFDRPLK